MTGSSFWQVMIYTIPPVIGALLCVVLLFVLIRKPTWLLFFFLCFYSISIFQLAGVLITSSIARRSGTFTIQQFWEIGLVVGRSRYIPLILFVHSAHRFRATPVLTGLMIAIVGIAIVFPFFAYSMIPNLVEIVVVLYAFSYWLAVYLLRNKLSISSSRQRLLRAVLLCSGFFMIGVMLDLVEAIPQASVYVSVLLVDFYPMYLVSVGVVMTFWQIHDLLRPSVPQELQRTRSIDVSALPVTRREKEIISLILTGETNSAIADRLFISESTVKKHVNNLFRKLGITSRWELLKLTEDIHPKE